MNDPPTALVGATPSGLGLMTNEVLGSRPSPRVAEYSNPGLRDATPSGLSIGKPSGWETKMSKLQTPHFSEVLLRAGLSLLAASPAITSQDIAEEKNYCHCKQRFVSILVS